MSVSPLSKEIVALVAPALLDKKAAQKLREKAGTAANKGGKGEGKSASGKQQGCMSGSAGKRAAQGAASADATGGTDGKPNGKGSPAGTEKQPQTVSLCGTPYTVQKVKGKKQLLLPWEQFSRTVEQLRAETCGHGTPAADGTGSRTHEDTALETGAAGNSTAGTGGAVYDGRLEQLKNLRAKITFGSYELLTGEKLGLILSVAEAFPLQPLGSDTPFPRTKNFTLPEDTAALLEQLPLIFRTVTAKQKSKQLGFITLFNDGNGTFWLKTSRGFHTALHENLASLQQLIDSAGAGLDEVQTAAVNSLYSKIAKLI